MGLFLRLVGVGIISVCGIIVSREYSKYLEKRISHYRGVLDLLIYLQDNCDFGRSAERISWHKFHNDVLEKCGILSALREGVGIADSFERHGRSLTVGDELKESILSVFRSCESGGFNERLSALKDEASREYERESNDKERNEKVAKALLVGGALAIGIMII